MGQSKIDIAGVIGAGAGMLATGGSPIGAIKGYQIGSTLGSTFSGSGQPSGASRGTTIAGGSGFNPMQGAGMMIPGSQATKDRSGRGASSGLEGLSLLLQLFSSLGGSGSQQQMPQPEGLALMPIPQAPQSGGSQIDIDTILASLVNQGMQPLPFNQGAQRIGLRR